MTLVSDGLCMALYFLEIECQLKPGDLRLKEIYDSLLKVQDDLIEYLLLLDGYSE